MSTLQPFKIYRSSAGSGKTFTLAKEYLKLALHRPEYYRHILAVTFTNKATREMKERIVEFLHIFSEGGPHPLTQELMEYLEMDEGAFQKRAQAVLSRILHGYSHFAVSTIDAFFQQVIRAFSKEVGLHGGFKLELEVDKVLSEVIDSLMAEVGENKALTAWLTRFAEDKVDEGKSWDTRNDMKGLAYEVLKEKFKSFEDEVVAVSGKPGFLDDFLSGMQQIKDDFEDFMASRGEVGLALMAQHQLEIGDFAYGKTGVANYFQKLVDGQDLTPGSRVYKALDNLEGWYTKTAKNRAQVEAAVEAGLMELLNEAVAHYETNKTTYESAKQVLRFIYAFGILTDVVRQLTVYKSDNDVMLIADAARFLKEIIDDNDAPFLYEKVGSFYNHFLIDEFQDTSGFQWDNFRPLVENSIAEGYGNLVVGDIKQSIYRWRGGDWKLLLDQIKEDIGRVHTVEDKLDTNYRSTENVVDFNNKVFAAGARLLSEACINELEAVKEPELKEALVQWSSKIEEAYHDVFQNIPTQKHDSDEKGMVNITYFDQTGVENEAGEPLTWKDQVTARLPQLIEELQDKGLDARDIAILVRNSRDGKAVADLMMDYKNSDQAKQGYNYEVISNEALFLSSAAAVRLLINILSYLDKPDDGLAKANIVYEYQQCVLRQQKHGLHELFNAIGQSTYAALLPDDFNSRKTFLNRLPLYELVEELIRLFRLGDYKGELAYLQGFQDVVLSFSNEEKGDIHSFLEWWAENGSKQTIQISSETNAIRVITIHKSKGLQFRAVIVPHCDWKIDNDPLKTNIIWCEGDTAPFDEIRHLPLKYGKTLKDTIYKKDYYVEMMQAYMDNLNLLYVAFTRAEEVLYAFCPKPKIGKKGGFNLGNVADVLYQLFDEGLEGLQTSWNSEAGIFALGETGGKFEKKVAETLVEPIQLSTYISDTWRSRLSIKRRGQDFFKAQKEQEATGINYTMLLKNLLARVKYSDDLSGVLEEMYYEGVISLEDQKILEAMVMKLWQHPQVKDWFDTRWEVKTEVPILPKSGEMARIDRVMVHEAIVVVVGFDAGTYQKKVKNEVSTYMQLMKEMGYHGLEGYVLKLSTAEITRL